MRIFFTIFLIFLTGCSLQTSLSPQSTQNNISFLAMDTQMSINILEENDEVLQLLKLRALELENIWSVGNPSSDIRMLNSQRSGFVCDETLEILLFAKDFSQKTDGSFDISVLPLIKAFGFTSSEYRVPSDDEISKILVDVNYENIIIDGNFVKLLSDTQITLGAIAKGCVANELLNILNEYNISSATIDLGGNIYTKGLKSDGSLWKIGIKNPKQTDEILGVLETKDSAVITCGGYENYFTENDNVYWHILDPKTGFPSTSDIVSVTIICDDNLYADTLSTSFFVMGSSRAIDFYHQYHDFDAIIITDTTVYITKDIVTSFNLSNEFSHLKLEVIS